jgi:hypothetical protein
MAEARDARAVIPVGVRWAIVAAGLLACATPKKDKLEQLRTSVEAYNEAFRWKYYERAASFLPNELRTPFLSAFEDEAGASLHVEDVKILEVSLESEDVAEITVRYRYLRIPSVTVQSQIVKQSWHRIGDNWILEYEDPPLVELPAATPSSPREEDAFGGDVFGADEDPGADTDVEVTTPWDDDEE